mmetsp:Transcript_10824/g.21745  ORF Transcript_10824/g.21745 Transcript_10824/m.21745 type:complete len:186 (-) Transcript_10824:138-695(-)|eukprot:CAMPEP_0181315438 /NCGR_PEP_ID=MMETSP1101-20121128/15379_1 /TAXON_ID=46948 /ORGANISM="Rhodomonas abbreviata, Strain Caron Lab Isolate" /LENGTH=185 /DNA_ID=CAMNT_0023422653 /DNA_START=27 /DNA_END=584 /DNA_ORIENTATION=+
MEAKRSSSFQSSPSASRPHVQEYHPTKQLKKVVSGPPQLGFLPQGFGDSMKMLDGLFQMNTNEMSSGSPPPEFSSRSSNPALAGAGSATRDQNQDQADLTPEEAVFAERCRKLSHWKARLAAAKKKISEGMAEKEEAERILDILALQDQVDCRESSSSDLEPSSDRGWSSVQRTSSDPSFRFWLL